MKDYQKLWESGKLSGQHVIIHGKRTRVTNMTHVVPGGFMVDPPVFNGEYNARFFTVKDIEPEVVATQES